MSIKFTGPFDKLKNKLKTIGGKWDEDQPNKKVLRLNGGVLNWFETTGALSFQGKNPGKEQLERSVPSLLYPSEYPKVNIAQPAQEETKNKEDDCTYN